MTPGCMRERSASFCTPTPTLHARRRHMDPGLSVLQRRMRVFLCVGEVRTEQLCDQSRAEPGRADIRVGGRLQSAKDRLSDLPSPSAACIVRLSSFVWTPDGKGARASYRRPPCSPLMPHPERPRGDGSQGGKAEKELEEAGRRANV